jgi:urease accessory protein
VTVRATVAAGGELQWLPEPVVAARACDHHLCTAIELEGDARLVWREEVVLGRHGEVPGSAVATVRVDLDRVALLRQTVALGAGHPTAAGPAVTDGARAVGSVLLVGEPWSACRTAIPVGPTAAVLPLAGPGVQVVALAEGASSLRRTLDEGLRVAAGVHA